jgi:hypothetical protein
VSTNEPCHGAIVAHRHSPRRAATWRRVSHTFRNVTSVESMTGLIGDLSHIGMLAQPPPRVTFRTPSQENMA